MKRTLKSITEFINIVNGNIQYTQLHYTKEGHEHNINVEITMNWSLGDIIKSVENKELSYSYEY